MNEKGAVLPSVIVFVFLLLIILLGSATIYRDQVHQLAITKESYKAKTMLQLTEKELMVRLENKETIATGTVVFDVGEVAIKKINPERYQIKATTDRQFKLQRDFVYTLKESSAEESSKAESLIESSTNLALP